MKVNLSSLLFLVDDAFIQSIKDVFGGGGGNKKNLVDPFLEARFAGRKVPSFLSFQLHSYMSEQFTSKSKC